MPTAVLPAFLRDLPATAVIEAADTGVFISLSGPRPLSRVTLPLGQVTGAARWSAVRRKGEPFWMLPVAGTAVGGVPNETQALFLELDDGRVAAVIPLVQAPARCCLRGAGTDRLEVMVETGDAHVAVGRVLAVWVGVGDEIHALMTAGAKAVTARLGSGRLRSEKSLPAWIDGFAWCTWDAFYQEVDQAKVRAGLESFKALGVMPRMMILDDGWQQEHVTLTGERRLSGLDANAKFPGGLAPLVRMAKDEFGLHAVMVWHAFNGYWNGVDANALPGYGVVEQARHLSPYLYQDMPNIDEWWGCLMGVVPAQHVHRFYHDYHRGLKAMGVDGVKVDNQAMIEGVAQGQGGRVTLMQTYREALEGSAAVHFYHNVINCMSCSNDMLYSAKTTNLTRTSTDFWPKRPESHGLHLWTNALVSLWFAEFIHADWDMFQSTHEMAAFHAAARAISGSPVYVSDKPGMHDAAVLRKLVCSDGSILRCAAPARPARDCCFRDLQGEDVALKLLNRNHHGAVVGVFNVQYHADAAERRTISATIAPADLTGGAEGKYAIWLHRSGAVHVASGNDGVTVELSEGVNGWEVATIVPIDDGFAPLGLAGMYNGGGAIVLVARDGKRYRRIILRDGGRFVAWSKRKPVAVQVAGENAKFRYDETTGLLSVEVKVKGAVEVAIELK